MVFLKKRREEKKLSQQQLSSLSGIPQTTISSIENGSRKNPGIETLLPIALALGCTIDDLIREDGKEGKAS